MIRMSMVVFVLLTLLVFSGTVAAKSYSDQGLAYLGCMQTGKAAGPIARPPNGGLGATGVVKCDYKDDAERPWYQCTFQYKWATGSGYGACAEAAGYENNHTFPVASKCNMKADMKNARFQGSAGSCSGGCTYAPVLGGGETYRRVTIKGVSFTSASTLAPTGDACSVGVDNSPPTFGDEDQCYQDSTLTQCVKKDGSICTQATTGRQFCWSPGESGIKTSGNQAASKVPDGKDSKVPPVPPKNGGDWEKVGEASVSITDTKNGSTTTNNSTVNNYNSSYGNQGNGASGNGGSGQGNGGSGDGSGSGNGSGDGDGEGDGDGDGPGAPGSGAGELYDGNGKTVAGVFGEFKSRVGDSPLIAAIRDFFTVNASGACPVFTVPASAYWESMTYDGHCSGDFLAALRAIGWVLMAIAALGAAYWALS